MNGLELAALLISIALVMAAASLRFLIGWAAAFFATSIVILLIGIFVAVGSTID